MHIWSSFDFVLRNQDAEIVVVHLCDLFGMVIKEIVLIVLIKQVVDCEEFFFSLNWYVDKFDLLTTEIIDSKVEIS